MAWDDTFVYKVSKVTSAQMNAIIAKIKNILAEDIQFSDSTVGDVSTSMHGYMPKIPGTPGSGFWRADGVWAAPGAGSITGTTGAADNGLIRADGTGGATFQGSAVTIDDSGSVNIPTGQKYKINGTALAYTDITGAGPGTVTATAGALTLNGIVGGAGTTDTKIITDLPTATTVGGAYAYRAGGTDVPYTDGGTGISTYPKRTIFLSTAGGVASTTNGDSGASTSETSSNKVCFRGVSFAAAATKYHEWGMVMPSNWDGGTVVATPMFLPVTSDASNHTIIFGLQGVSFASTEAKDTAYGTTQESTYTVAADQSAAVIFGPDTAAITVGGASPAGGEFVQWRVYRKGASDTYTGAVILLGMKIIYQTNGTSDA